MGKAVAAYREAGDLHRWGAAALMFSWMLIARGDLAGARTLTSEIVRAGKDAADPQMASWGFQSLGRALLALGPLEEAEAVLREGRALAQRIQCLGQPAASAGSAGALPRAAGQAGRVRAAARRGPRHHTTGEDAPGLRPGGGAGCRCGLSAWPWSSASRDARRATALREAQRACRKAHRCALQMPMWLPTMLRLKGTADWLGGDAAAACKHWQRSLKRGRALPSSRSSAP